MKRYIFSIFAFALPFLSGHSQNAGCHILCDDFQQLQVSFAAGELTAHPAAIDGHAFSILQMDGAMFSQKAGDPNLPTFSSLIEAPLCQGFSVEVSQAQYDTIALASLGADSPVMPLQPSRSKSDTAHHPLVWNKDTYTADAYLGAELALVEPVGIARDRNLARLQISPVRYNPIQGSLIVCRQAVITVRYNGADSTASVQMFERYHSPAFSMGATLNSLYPKSVRTAPPVRYLIVAHSSFRGQLDDFIAWKRRKGFLTDIVYTDDSVVGSNLTVSPYLHSLYDNATASNPAPTYVLIVGDHEQIPAFTGTTSTSHITDLPYMTWTSGDHIPDCYYGRFSAQNASQLTPQIEKTLMYEQYTFNDPSFLDRAVMVAGVDGGSSGDYGYTHADPAMDYSVTNYINGSHGFSNVYYFKNNTSIVPTAAGVTIGSSASSNSATVRNYYNQGAGWINYSAHGSATSWGTPNFSTTHVASMTNSQKFGIMIGNCCLTNKFENPACLGEALLRKDNYCGAVGYIGGTNSTYWYEDFYWAVGLRTSTAIGPTMSMAYDAAHMGNYDALCHTHGQPHSQWVETQGAMVVNGNTIVESGTSSANMKYYYWEIYQLMGDPSLMPYLTQADTIAISAPAVLTCGTPSMAVHAVPYAYIALTDTASHTLIASAYTDSAGTATLMLPADLSTGGYEIAASAQQYRTTFKPLDVIAPDGPYAVASMPHAAVAAGSDTWLPGFVANLGTQPAANVIVRFGCASPDITLLTDSVILPASPISAGDTVFIDSLVHIRAATHMPDMASFAITANTAWDSSTIASEIANGMVCHAPRIAIRYDSLPAYVLPGGHYTITVEASNIGHSPMPASAMALSSPIYQAQTSPADTVPTAITIGATALRQFSLDIDSAVPYNIAIPLEVAFGSPFHIENASATLAVGQPVSETFEGMVFHISGWDQSASTHPWHITSDESHAGAYSLRSASGLGNDQTSEITLTRTSPINDSISFYYKVSSEANYDKFHFFIDGTELIAASGLVDWTRAAYPISAGTHTFHFSYQKDYSLARNSDCAWIDDLQLPPSPRPWRTYHDTLCYGEPLLSMGSVVSTLVPGNIYITDTTSDTVLFLRYTVLPQRLVDTAITACDQYLWRDSAYTDSTTLFATLQIPGECPIDYHYHLTINHSTYAVVEKSACDSLALWGQVFSQSGRYFTTLANAQGCDSLVTLLLTINRSVVDSVRLTADSPYVWNGQVYTASGTYAQLFQTSQGCDSLVVLILTYEEDEEGISRTGDSPALHCYPNPTGGTIQFGGTASRVVIYDLLGREAMTLRDARAADLRSLPDGIYTVEITQPNGYAVRARIVLSR